MTSEQLHCERAKGKYGDYCRTCSQLLIILFDTDLWSGSVLPVFITRLNQEALSAVKWRFGKLHRDTQEINYRHDQTPSRLKALGTVLGNTIAITTTRRQV